MADKQLVMILERSNGNLQVDKNNDEYVLEGVFAQFGVENNNHRIYEEKEYLPHLDYLQKKIKENRLLGELDHPEKFDVSLSKVSHLIEDIKYDSKKRQIVGRIKLLDTPSGQIAKNLVDTGVPISISSRAAGVVGENKKVQIKRIFTYDLVADPGFENARLNKVNESFGFDAHDDVIAIYDMTEEFPAFLESFDSSENVKEEKTEKPMDSKEFVSVEEMNQYSVIIKKEIEKINERLSKIGESSDKDEKIASLEEEINNLRSYANYLAESQNRAVEYAGYLAEKLNQGISYSEHIAEKADAGIAYAEHIAEKADAGIRYSEKLAETLDNGLRYMDYLAENFDNSIDYSQYIAENLGKNIIYGNYLAGKIDESIAYAEHIAEHADSSIAYSEYIAENAATKKDFQNLTEYAEYMFENMGADFGRKSDISEENDNAPKKSLLDGAVKESKSILERYSSIDEKIETVLDSIRKQKVEERNEDKQYPFTKFLSESKRNEFFALNEADKKRVTNALNNNPSFNEERIVAVWEKAIASTQGDKWLSDMPVEYLPLWESATPETKDKITRQAQLFRLESPYQIKNFWQTRGLDKNNAPLNENEKAVAAEPVKPNDLGYDKSYVDSIREQLGKFNR